MKRFLLAVLTIFFVAATTSGAVKTYEGTDEYYVLGAVENINVARERARERALRNAREKAGVYIHAISKAINMKMIEDEIITVASGVLHVVETAYEIIPMSDKEGYVIRAKVKADIDTSHVENFLKKDAEELAKIVANEKAIRRQEQDQENKIDSLKQEYVLAETSEEKEAIAQQIVEEDKIFLSNLKLREGNNFRDESKHKRAAEIFSEAIELNPENFLAWHNRAWAYFEQKNYKQAMSDFDKAAELSPNSELPYFGRGCVYHQINEFENAIKEYNKAVELNPKYAIAWNNRGASKSWLNQMNEAIADYDKAIELNPSYAKAYENRGKAFSALGNYEKSAEDRRRSEHIKWSNEQADKIIEEAIDLGKRGDFKKALKLLNDAAKLYPDNQYVYVNRGNIYSDYLRDYDRALADYNKTIELNPKFSWPYFNRALVYRRLNKNDLALVNYEKALELDPNYADAYNSRAWMYCQQEKYDEALVDVDKALKLKPNEANFYDTRACAYMGLKRYEEALSDIDIAIKLSPEGQYYQRRGEIYRLMGNETNAQDDFDKAKRLG